MSNHAKSSVWGFAGAGAHGEEVVPSPRKGPSHSSLSSRHRRRLRRQIAQSHGVEVSNATIRAVEERLFKCGIDVNQENVLARVVFEDG
jgi:hypothetical protein